VLGFAGDRLHGRALLGQQGVAQQALGLA